MCLRGSHQLLMARWGLDPALVYPGTQVVPLRLTRCGCGGLGSAREGLGCQGRHVWLSMLHLPRIRPPVHFSHSLIHPASVYGLFEPVLGTAVKIPAPRSRCAHLYGGW